MSGLRVSDDLVLPDEAVTDTFAMLAKRGAGKTNAAAVMAEAMFDRGFPWVALDPVGSWWGLRAAGEGRAGLPVLVLGGRHGDLPLEPGSGALTADLLVDHNLSAVLDLALMDDQEELPEFCADFQRRLFQRNQEPRHVFYEEADVTLPQVPTKEAQAMLRWGLKLIKLGRGQGLGCSLITQRVASLNKSAIAQVETLIALRTKWAGDRKVIADWMRSHEGDLTVLDELGNLEPGEAFISSPEWLGEVRRVKFRRRATYDSGATPKVGEARRPPGDLAKVDLGALRDAMAATIAQVEAEDPERLRAQITELRRQLAERPQAAPAESEIVKIPVLDDDDRDLLRAAAGQVAGGLEALQIFVAETVPGLDRIAGLLGAAAEPPTDEVARLPASAPEHAQPADAGRRRRSAEAAVPAVATAGDLPQLRAGAVRMVKALGQFAPLRLTESQWATVARFKVTGGTWRTYRAELRKHELVEENDAGYTVTDRGFALLGGRPEPLDLAGLQERYYQVLRAGAGKMLRLLIERYPAPMMVDDLAQAVGMERSGGTFRTYMGDLTRNGLAERGDGEVRATPMIATGAR